MFYPQRVLGTFPRLPGLQEHLDNAFRDTQGGILGCQSWTPQSLWLLSLQDILMINSFCW